MGINLWFENKKDIQEFIKNNDSSIYNGKNDKGEMVVVLLEKGKGFTAKTYQVNGWIRVNEYDKNGSMTDETFEGRYE